MIEQLQKLMGGFVLRWGDNVFRMTAKLAEELGEVSEAVALLMGDSRKRVKYKELSHDDAKLKLAEELGDLIAVAMAIGLSFGIPSKVIFEKAIAKFSIFSSKYDTPRIKSPEVG